MYRMFIFIVFSILLNNCVTSKPEEPKYTPKYKVGECAKFDPNKIRLKTEGIPILIVDVIHEGEVYQVLMRYEEEDYDMLFISKRFDEDSLKTECSGYLKCVSLCRNKPDTVCIQSCRP